MKKTPSRTYARWERAVMQRFRDAMPAPDREPAAGAPAATAEEADLQHFRIETVTGERGDVLAALRSARRPARDSRRIPVVVAKRDRAKPFVAVDLEDFLLLVAAWWASTDVSGDEARERPDARVETTPEGPWANAAVDAPRAPPPDE